MNTLSAAREALRTAILAATMAGMLSAGWVMGKAALVDAQLSRLRWQIGQWQSAKAPLPSITEWGKARNLLADNLALTPDDPQIYEALGYLYAIRAQSVVKLPALFESFMRQAQDSYLLAARLRPMSGATWVNVALVSHQLLTSTDTPAVQPVLWDAFDRALRYGQREPYVQRTVAEIGFARWAQLSTARRSELLSMVANAWPANQPQLLTIAHKHGRAEADGVKADGIKPDAKAAALNAR